MNRTLTLLIMATLFFASSVMAQTPTFIEESEEDKDAPLEVTADRMVSDNKNNVISFFGSVVALKGSLRVEADEMRAHTVDNQSEFTDIEAIGSVKITHKDKVATGEKAFYYAAKRMIVITGDATMIDGKNRATGEKVIYYLDSEKMILTGAEGKRPTLKLFPSSKKDKTEKDKSKTEVTPHGEGEG